MERRRFEYEVSVYPAESFQEVVYFCTATGVCERGEAPADMARSLAEALNVRGSEGWELVQITFSARGAVGFWKREAP
jgi:hypothetical protein